MQTCIFCDSMILTALEPFANHLTNHHLIKNSVFVLNAKLSTVVHRLVNLPLVTFHAATRKVECCLCDKPALDCRNGGEEWVRHMVECHRIKQPSRILFPLFTGTEFHYHNLQAAPAEHCNRAAG